MSESSNSEDINIIIPVAPSEPKNVLENSLDSVSSLEAPEGFEKTVYYVVDSENSSEDERIEFLEEKNIELIVRGPDSGRKASALNEALENMNSPRYVVVFDVDSRPAKNFLKEGKKKLEEEEDYFIASCPRKIVNKDRNMVTKIISTEFKFFEDMQRISNNGRGFNLFNGPIAVIDGSFAVNNGFNEGVLCEDTYFTEKGYLEGRRAVMTLKTSVGEQAVTNLSDLYSQKMRWMAGAREGLENFTFPMISSDNSLSVKLSWLTAMIFPFFAFLFSPLSFLYVLRLIWGGSSIIESVKVGFATFFYTWFISFCGLVVLKRRFMGQGISWGQAEREDM